MIDYLLKLLRCPECRSGSLVVSNDLRHVECVRCPARFPIYAERPVLLRSDNQLFRSDDYKGGGQDCSKVKSKYSNLIPSPSLNLARKKVLSTLRDSICGLDSVIILVVGGGNQRCWLDLWLDRNETTNIIYTDIDVWADVDIYSDAHDLPFQNESVDVVITTAVLEHVLYPERAASEIQRVLKVDGLLYSELPFMQQVHEGAYDFTRYTHSGHRRLFNYIDEIKSGMVAGPATALVWSIEGFVLAFVNHRVFSYFFKILIRITFGWIKYFDHVLSDKPQAMDAASCTYLFGKKMKIKLKDADIISGYIGNKHLNHT